MRTALLVVAFLLILQPVSGVAIGVNKGTLNFDNVLREGYAEDVITVTTDTADQIALDYQFRGDIAEWMRLLPENESELFFSSNNPLEVTVIVEPPVDAANGVYEGELRLLTGEFARTGGQYGSAVRASFSVKIRVEITGEEILACTAGGFDIIDTEVGYPLELHATIKNTGNVRLLPEFEVDVWDQYQTQLLHTTAITEDERILPTRQESFLETIDAELGIGQYWAWVRTPACEKEALVTFSVVELGGIVDRGELIRIDNQPWAETNDIVRIAAIFKNLGARVVNAKFKGTIEKQGKVVEVIETDSLQVNPSDTSELETFFNPQEPGRYEVKGRVIYNNKLTYEKSSMINVQGDVAPRVTGNVNSRMLRNPYQLTMVLILAAIGFLLFLINKEKKKRARRW